MQHNYHYVELNFGLKIRISMTAGFAGRKIFGPTLAGPEFLS